MRIDLKDADKWSVRCMMDSLERYFKNVNVFCCRTKESHLPRSAGWRARSTVWPRPGLANSYWFTAYHWKSAFLCLNIRLNTNEAHTVCSYLLMVYRRVHASKYSCSWGGEAEEAWRKKHKEHIYCNVNVHMKVGVNTKLSS